MSEVYTNIICSTMMSILGFYIIKKILKSEVKLFNVKTIVYLLVLTVVAIFFHDIKYAGLYTITVFLLNIIVYKVIFGISIEESVICVGILMFVLFFGDLVVTILFRTVYTVQQMRSISYVYIASNLSVTAFSCIIVNIPFVRKQLYNFYLNNVKRKLIINIIFFILLIIGFSLLAYNMTLLISWNTEYIINFVIMIIFFIIAYVYINNRNDYNRLSKEYDSLFNYIQNFEDWIEKEQLNRHEYKNQLAVLRGITKENKTKNKIDEILEDNINIDGDVVNQLKTLPKGGIKGLMYYKLVIAQKNKINLTIDVSIKKKSILNKLSEKQVRDLCKLIGIYFDNAIEAAKETRKKNVLVEIYELKDKTNIVFSNTFKKSKKFDNRYNKGISSKGKGRGNGLFFAKKIISNNRWIKEEQEVIDKFYIQKLIILKLEK